MRLFTMACGFLLFGACFIMAAPVRSAPILGVMPEQAMGWLDVIEEAGMPGIIAVLLWCIWYLAFRRIPAIETAAKGREDKLDAENKELWTQALAYRDTVSSTHMEYVEQRTQATTQLEATLKQVLEALQHLKRGRNGSG